MVDGWRLRIGTGSMDPAVNSMEILYIFTIRNNAVLIQLFSDFKEKKKKKIPNKYVW